MSSSSYIQWCFSPLHLNALNLIHYNKTTGNIPILNICLSFSALLLHHTIPVMLLQFSWFVFSLPLFLEFIKTLSNEIAQKPTLQIHCPCCQSWWVVEAGEINDPVWSLWWTVRPITTENISYDPFQGSGYLCTSNLTDSTTVQKQSALFGDWCRACIPETRNKCRQRVRDVCVYFH